MKRIFGSTLMRLLRGGTTLSEGEYALLRSLVRELPERIRSVVESQFTEYNLVQRESDRRALNFYRMRSFSRTPVAVSQLLQAKSQEAPLIRITAKVGADSEPLHAVLTVVNGRAFSVSFSRPVPFMQSEQQLEVLDVTPSWKSNFLAQ